MLLVVDPLGGGQGVGAAELPLVERGDVPHAQVVADPAYSAARSPNPSVQYQPPSSMKVAPMAAAGS